MTESKSRLLYILKYLWQNTDEEHFASTADIVSGLAEKDIDIDRHTLPADIEALQRAGFDIECQKSSRNLYYLSSRTFELPELKLLVDAVESSRFIPAKRSRELVEKLCSLTSVHLAKELNRHLFVEGRIKSDNRALYYTIDTIHKAINCKGRYAFGTTNTPCRRKKYLSIMAAITSSARMPCFGAAIITTFSVTLSGTEKSQSSALTVWNARPFWKRARRASRTALIRLPI